MFKCILTRLFEFISITIAAFYSVTTHSSQNELTTHVEQSIFHDTLLLCKNNINHLNLLPTILNQKGWEEVSLDEKERFYEKNSRLYKKISYEGEYQIKFGSFPAVDKCSIKIDRLEKIPPRFMENTLSTFTPIDDHVYSCRFDNANLPVKIIEWTSYNQSYITYFSVLNTNKMLYFLTIDIKKAKSKAYEFISICKKGKL